MVNTLHRNNRPSALPKTGIITKGATATIRSKDKAGDVKLLSSARDAFNSNDVQKLIPLITVETTRRPLF